MFANSAGVQGVYDVAVCLAATLVGDETTSGFAALDFPDIEQARYDARWVARRRVSLHSPFGLGFNGSHPDRLDDPLRRELGPLARRAHGFR